MRKYWYIVAVALLVIATAGCSATTEENAKPASDDAAAASSDKQAATDTTPEAADAGIATLEPETDGERTALTAAASAEGRVWATGNAVGATPIQGEPFLAGYICVVHDGTTQYQVKVLDGAVVPFFGTTGLTLIPSSFGNNPTIAPETTRQQAAVAAAVAEVAKTNSAATQGGIESYVTYFPSTTPGTHMGVQIYANTSVGTFSMGGSDAR